MKFGLVCCHGNNFSSEFKYFKVTQQKLSLQKYKANVLAMGLKIANYETKIRSFSISTILYLPLCMYNVLM